MSPLSQQNQRQRLQLQGWRYLLCLSSSCRFRVQFSVPKCCRFSLKCVPLSHQHWEDQSRAWAPPWQHLSLFPSGITFVTIHCLNEWRPCSRLY